MLDISLAVFVVSFIVGLATSIQINNGIINNKIEKRFRVIVAVITVSLITSVAFFIVEIIGG